MKNKLFAAIIGILLLSVIAPASAYDVDEVDITIMPDGSATITGDYKLNWGEFIAFSLISNKEAMAEDKIEDLLGRDVTVNYITSTEASVTVPSFAKVTSTDGVLSYTSRVLPYNKVDLYLDRFTRDYPILKGFISDSDANIPDKTVITFPDGYTFEYSKPYPDGFVPHITH